MIMLTKEDIRNLMEAEDQNCVTIYMPALPMEERKQNRIRFKNLLSEAEKQLEKTGMRDVGEYISEALKLVDDTPFWERQKGGLALFLSSDIFRYYSLPMKFEEKSIVSDRFHIKPLIPLLSHDGKYYLIAISRSDIRLYGGTHYQLNEINLEDMPKSIAEVLRYDEAEENIQFYTGTPGTGKRPAIFFGPGSDLYEDRDRIVRYFKEVDKRITDHLKDLNSPLVIAGLDQNTSLYKEASDYPRLMDETIDKNPEDLDEKKLHQMSWQIVEPLFSLERREALDAYYHLASEAEKVSHKLSDIVPSAAQGKVKYLFVASDKEAWGRYFPEKFEVELHKERQPLDQDLLDVAACQAVLNGGMTYTLPVNKMPNEHECAAIYRYE